MAQIAHNIYIHVPFCVKRCKYCAFFSRACANPDWDTWGERIISEIKSWHARLGNIVVPTIFFGGGTPSLMPTDVFAKIIGAINKNFYIESNAEISIETNPGTIDKIKMTQFCDAGANRISIGVQSFDDKKLQFLGRIHSANDAMRTIDMAMQIGVRVSADFIYGLPGDKIQDIIHMCKTINKIGITHCSLYELTIEENTPLSKMKLDMPDNNTMAEMYMAIQKHLNMPRYEVSNYAVDGHECQHNMNIWDGAPYIGIGRGAAGRIFINNTWYEQMGDETLFQPISDSDRAIERLITGIRTTRGVFLDNAIKQITDLEFAKSHSDVLMFSGERIHATDSGMLILDDIIEKLVK